MNDTAVTPGELQIWNRTKTTTIIEWQQGRCGRTERKRSACFELFLCKQAELVINSDEVNQKKQQGWPVLLVAKRFKPFFVRFEQINKRRTSSRMCGLLSVHRCHAHWRDDNWQKQQQQRQAVWSSEAPGPWPANKSSSTKIRRLKRLGACPLPVSFYSFTHVRSSDAADLSLPGRVPASEAVRSSAVWMLRLGWVCPVCLVDIDR